MLKWWPEWIIVCHKSFVPLPKALNFFDDFYFFCEKIYNQHCDWSLTLVVDMKISHRILYQTSLNFLLRNISINFQNIKSILNAGPTKFWCWVKFTILDYFNCLTLYTWRNNDYCSMNLNSWVIKITNLNKGRWQWCWWQHCIDDFMMVSILRVRYHTSETVTNIWMMSPTSCITNIRHKKRCNRITNLYRVFANIKAVLAKPNGFLTNFFWL